MSFSLTLMEWPSLFVDVGIAVYMQNGQCVVPELHGQDLLQHVILSDLKTSYDKLLIQLSN